MTAFLGLSSRHNSAPIEGGAKVEKAAIQGIQYAWNDKLVLKSGAEIRSVPVNPMDGDNAATTIKKVKDLFVVDQPVFTDEAPNGDVWLAFRVMADRDSLKSISGSAYPENLDWVDYSYLKSIGKAVLYKEPGSRLPILDVSIDRNANFVSTENPGVPLALGSAMSTASFNEIVDRQNLQIDNSK